jgi:6-phosphofructo-2-kinase/fructose-2,6-biphosphatase 2
MCRHTDISHKLCRYLNWIGIKTKGFSHVKYKMLSNSVAFNVGEYRRQACDFFQQGASEFFKPSNEKGTQIRELAKYSIEGNQAFLFSSHCAKLAMLDMGRYLEDKEGEVAVGLRAKRLYL